MSLKRGVAGGEMGPLVSKVGRSQQGVHDGVHQDVAVAMAGEAPVVLNFHAAQHELASGGQWVRIEAYASAEIDVLRGCHPRPISPGAPWLAGMLRPG